MSSDQNRPRTIVWIAIPRTGTNFLCSLVYHHPAIASYYEIFHPDQFYAGYKTNVGGIIDYINRKYALNFSTAEDPQLIQWIHNNPAELIDTLLYFNPERYISFKLFPEHLDREAVKSTIIENRNIRKILVKRDLLTAYISHEIALQTYKWDNFDTSDIKISISVEKFTRWLNWAEAWYELFEEYDYLDERECSTINYEDIHAHQTNRDKLAYIDRFLKNIGLEFQQYRLPSDDCIKIMQKQDKRKNLIEKIINYQDFRREIKDRGLDKGFRYI